MTDISMAIEVPSTTETVEFLRRFAELMSKGQNALYLRNAAVLLETLAARLIAALDEKRHWQETYEILGRQLETLEIERETLKQDMDGHLEIISSILSERDGLQAKLQARDEEVSILTAELGSERSQASEKTQSHEKALAELRDAIGQQCKVHNQTLEQREAEMNKLRRVFEHDRAELRSQIKVSRDELSAVRVVSFRQCDELRAKIVSLESNREKAGVEIVAPSISEQSTLDVSQFQASAGDRNIVSRDTDAVVPNSALRQARAQFEYLAKECIARGDVVSQFMCELGAHNIELALTAGSNAINSQVGEVVLSILASDGSAYTVDANAGARQV